MSHDRYFLDNLVDRIFAFEGEGALKQYEGGYTDYLEARQRMVGDVTDKQSKNSNQSNNADNQTNKKPTGKDWKQNQPTKLKFSYKEQKEYETIDDDIATLEERIEELEQKMLKNATNSAKLSEIMAQKEETEHALEEKMERWVYLNDLAEKIATQG